MAKATKLPSGRWRIRVYTGEENGKKKMKSITADTKKEAQLLAAQYQMEKEELSNDDCTVKDAIDRYIANRENVLSPSTIKGYVAYQKKAYDSINNIMISNLSSENIQQFVNAYAISHSPKTTRNAYGLLVAAIKAVLPDKAINVRLPQKKPLERSIPTDSDIKKLLSIANRDMRIAIMFAALCTLRRGEVCALCYEDIKKDMIHVHRDMVQNKDGKFVIKDIPKTNSSDRYINVPKQLIKEIGKGKGQIININPNTLSKNYSELCKKIGISTRFHDLRHYAASIMHAIGIPDQYIMEVGGWSSDAILKSVYRNVLEDKKNEFDNKRNEYMEKFF